MKLALVASAHGFGHLTRLLAIGEELRVLGVEPTLFTAAPPQIVEESLPGARLVPWAVDVGLVQQDSLTEDIGATRTALGERCADAAISRLAEALTPFDRVVSDTAAPALEAARRAKVDAVAMGNFDWAWTYRRYPGLAAWADRFSAWQRPHPGLSLWPGPGLREFDRTAAVGLIGRVRPPHRVAERACLVSFGGLGLRHLDALLPRIDGLTWVLAPPMAPLARPDCRFVTGVPYPSLVAGCDLVFTKPGYGILAECILGGTGIVWAHRGAFPEAPFLEAPMRARGDEKVTASPSDPPAFRQALARAIAVRLGRGAPTGGRASEAARVAERLLRSNPIS